MPRPRSGTPTEWRPPPHALPTSRAQILRGHPSDGAASGEQRSIEAHAAGFPACPALEVVAPGSLKARNGLDRPDAVRPQTAAASVDGQRVRFTLPAQSAAVATIGRR